MSTPPLSTWSLARRLAVFTALGVAAAALAGTLGTVVVAVQRVAGGFAWVPRDYVWMSPIAYGVLFVPLALVAGCVSMFVRHVRFFAFTVFGLSLLAWFGLFLPFGAISRAAALALAMGLSAVAGRTALAHPARVAAMATRVAITSLVVFPLLAFLFPWGRAQLEERSVGQLPPPRPGSPNVLLVVLDAARAKSLGFITSGANTTPRLDAWRKSSTVFSNAYAVGPWSMPSHGSMMTGEYASALSADWLVPLDAKHTVLAELFRDAGYLTGGFVANLYYTGWDSGLARGFVHYDDYERNWPQILLSSAYAQTSLGDTLRRVPALATLKNVLHPDLSMIRQNRYRSRLGDEVVDAFLGWEKARDGRPYFAFLNLMDAHLATSAPEETRRQYPPPERPAADYEAAMRYLDHAVDRLLTTLEQRGSLDQTLVILTADHGELLGEHGLAGHAQSVYRDVLHVPLLMRLPDRIPGAYAVRTPVSLRDLAATILDLAGLPNAKIPGASLAAHWRDSVGATSAPLAEVRQQPNPLGDYPTASGDLSALFGPDWYYIKNHGTGKEELFHFSVDTAEATNEAANPAARDVLAGFRGQLNQILRRRSPGGAP